MQEEVSDQQVNRSNDLIEEDEEEEEEEEALDDQMADAGSISQHDLNAKNNSNTNGEYLYGQSDGSHSAGTSGSLESESWISSFCGMVGHEFFAEVHEDFIEDDFNLTGLGALVPHYREALEVILDLEPEQPFKLPNIPLIEHSAELLYGLIHARFITSRQGLQIMAQKYEYEHFGLCPRYLCDGTRLLPIGRHDLPGFETVRLYCPCCSDIYVPPNSRFYNIDGAFFGTSFPGLFLKSFPEIEKQATSKRWNQFELKIYGFRVSEYSRSGPRMKWLRQRPTDMRELDDDYIPGEQGEKEGRDRISSEQDENESTMSISVNGEL